MPRPLEVITGSQTGDGAEVIITVGFKPKYVKFTNTTDRIGWEKTDTMAATESIKIAAAGTRTLETGTDIALTDTGFTVSAGANVNAKDTDWLVIGPGVS